MFQYQKIRFGVRRGGGKAYIKKHRLPRSPQKRIIVKEYRNRVDDRTDKGQVVQEVADNLSKEDG